MAQRFRNGALRDENGATITAPIDALHAKIDNAAAAGDLVVVPAVPGFKIRVMSYLFVEAAAGAVTWKRGAVALSGPMSLAINGGLVAGAGTVAWFETAVNEALNLGCPAVQVSGHMTYLLVT